MLYHTLDLWGSYFPTGRILKGRFVVECTSWTRKSEKRIFKLFSKHFSELEYELMFWSKTWKISDDIFREKLSLEKSYVSLLIFDTFEQNWTNIYNMIFSSKINFRFFFDQTLCEMIILQPTYEKQTHAHLFKFYYTDFLITTIA